MSTSRGFTVSAIVPTIGRPDSLRRLLESLCAQTCKVDEVIVADSSSTGETVMLVSDAYWALGNLCIRRLTVQPPNAVRQRQAAIAVATGEFLLLLDDDVVLERDCVEQMIQLLSRENGIVGVVADFNNQSWSMPTRAWRFYLRYVLRMKEGTWQGRVIGPLLRFGFNPVPEEPVPMEWLGTCNTMIRRSAYDQAGGFSNFFLRRCTMNEDVDLGLKLSKVGRIMFCPSARMGHFHAFGGRVSTAMAAEDDVFNRFQIMYQTLKYSRIRSLLLIFVFISIESLSNIIGAIRRVRTGTTVQLLHGRLRGLGQILHTGFDLKPPAPREA